MTGWKNRIEDRRVGLVVWSIGMLLTRPSLAGAILIFAAVVIVPMGLRLIGADQLSRTPELRSGFFILTRFVAALLLIASFGLPQGLGAGVLATPWMFVTYWLALCGLTRRIQNLKTWDYAAGMDMACIFIAVGGTFTVFSRLGIRVNDFSDQIILLTAVHFHYAGFVLPLMAALVARKLPDFVSHAVLYGCLGFTVLLAVGINSSPPLEMFAAMGLVLCCVALAIVQFLIGLHSRQPHLLAMLTVSSLSLIGAMGMATVYALSEYYETKWMDIATMIPIHGMANAFGFSYCGLWAWEPEFRRKRGLV